MSEITTERIDQWLKEFNKKHIVNNQVTEVTLLDLAYSLCDDIPLGYEASHRLASLLINYSDRSKPSKRFKDIDHIIDHNQKVENALEEILYNYKNSVNDLRILIDTLNKN